MKAEKSVSGGVPDVAWHAACRPDRDGLATRVREQWWAGLTASSFHDYEKDVHSVLNVRNANTPV